MAYTDFDLLSETYSSSYGAAPVAAGYAHANSALATPLTSSGVYCRRLRHAHGSGGSGFNLTEVTHYLKTTIASGAFVNPNQSHAISLRANIRVGSPENGNSTSYFFSGLAAYSSTGAGFNMSGGYMLGFYQLHTNATTLQIRLGPPTQVSASTFIQCSGTYVANRWYTVRMDLIPLSASQKRIDAYTSQDDGSSWDLVGTYTLDSGNANWRTSGRCGVVSSYQTSSPGAAWSAAGTFYIDDFKSYLITNSP